MSTGGLVKALRDPDVAVPLAVLLGFVFWGPEGLLLFDVGAVFGLQPPEAWMVRFGLGALLMVGLPLVVIRFWIRPSDASERSPSEWGFGLGEWKKGLLWMGVATLVGGAVMFWGTSRSADMQAEYPLFMPGTGNPPLETGRFVAYEATYFLFFLCGEASMRGVLLFGLERRLGAKSAIVITSLIQTVWHLGKPIAELAVAPIWGLAIGAINLRLRSFWWMLVFHWITNVLLDVAIHYHR